MKTVKVVDQVESYVQALRFGFCVEENDEEFDSYKTVDDMTEAETEKVAKRHGVSAAFLDEIDAAFRDLRDATHRDLADIWARLSERS
jgi:predicted RNA-binding protein with EMAP domain